jgi:hypothetical protein
MIWHYSFSDEMKPFRNKWCPELRDGTAYVPSGKTFWYLKLTTFEGFLKRRSEASRNPKKHFPSIETYRKPEHELIYKPYDFNEFACIYDKLKRPEHKSAHKMKKEVKIDGALCRMAMYGTEGICWIVDDGRSASLINLASVIDNRGVGIVMLVELVKYLCENGYKSFDAGVSGYYGGYKHKVFLDSITG